MPKKLKKRRQRRYLPSAPPHVTVLRRLPRSRIEIDRGLSWSVIWTAARAERRVATALQEAGLATYSPVEAFSTIRRAKAVEIERPAIGRYVFVGLHGATPQWAAVHEALDGPYGWMLGVPALGRVLKSADGIALKVPAGALQRLADGLTVLDTKESRLAAGGACKAISGPLAGFLGIVQSSDDYRVRALLDVFGRKTLVAFEPGQLEAA